MSVLKTVFTTRRLYYVLGLVFLFCFACDESPYPYVDNTSHHQPKELPEDLRLMISQQLDSAFQAESREQIDSAIYWYSNVCETYSEHYQWDSLYTTLVDAFYTCYPTSDFQELKPFLTHCY
ncbi:MAG: hypothetical protein AAGJ93_10885, partial [Bacteroidota bacterium]